MLIANLYDLAPGPRSFLHPGAAPLGRAHALGLGTTAAYLVWKPVAVLALWAGAVAWAGRFLARRERSAARGRGARAPLRLARRRAVGWRGSAARA